MAIDDNTSYELTGRQVKDLANKVKAKADSASLASVATSGLYSDLTGAPTIPTVNNGTLTIQQNGTTVGTFTANQSTNTTVSLTDTTYSEMTGATSGAAGTSGLTPAPAAGDQDKVLKGDGTWGAVTNTSIDWSTFPGRIIAAGQINVGAVNANYGKEATEYIPTQADSNYSVILTHAAQVNGYDKCMPAVKYKYTDRFVANIWNSGSSASGNIRLDYVVIKY